ncbi:MAG: A/G-specific adenine glycosylase [Planctomycetota bacterium]
MPPSPPPIAASLLRWFGRHQRDLPWRRTKEPYAIWISEVMLQQTRVATVIPYYERFLARFPDVTTLAAAEEDDVLEHWAGLGYYSRGRNLHRAAEFVVRECASRFPRSAAQLRALPGVGEYTAAAVSSIAYDESVPVIDGNVERVLCRYLTLAGDPKKGNAKRQLQAAAAALVPTRRAGDYNQALMELGATICSPRDPDCAACPIRGGCRSAELGVTDQYPTPRSRRAAETQHWVATVIVTRQGPQWGAAITRSPRNAELLAGHWGVPLQRMHGDTAPRMETVCEVGAQLARDQLGPRADLELVAVEVPTVRHAITFRRLRLHVAVLRCEQPLPDDWRVCASTDTGALPALHRKLIRAALTAISEPE